MKKKTRICLLTVYAVESQSSGVFSYSVSKLWGDLGNWLILIINNTMKVFRIQKLPNLAQNPQGVKSVDSNSCYLSGIGEPWLCCNSFYGNSPVFPSRSSDCG